MPSELETWVNAKSFTSGVSNCVELFERERAVVAHRHEAKLRADSFGQELPRHEVAVVLHLGEQNHIAGAKKFSAPGLRHEVDALRRSAREDDFVRACRAQIIRHALARSLVSFGRARAQFVQTAMHIGVVVFVIMPQRLDHRARREPGRSVRRPWDRPRRPPSGPVC